MNATLNTILTRRSIRKYKQEQIKEEDLMTILKAGSFAPSGKNQQPWHFTAIQNEKILKEINERCIEALTTSGNETLAEKLKTAHPASINLLYNAPTLIIVSASNTAIEPVIDSSLALQNMMLAAESLALGTCWVYALKLFYCTDEGKSFLINENLIPKDYILVGSIAVGYKAIESPSASPRKEETFSIIK